MSTLDDIKRLRADYQDGKTTATVDEKKRLKSVLIHIFFIPSLKIKSTFKKSGFNY